MKKLLSVLLIVFVLISLCSCGGSKTEASLDAKLYFLDEDMNFAVEMRNIKAENIYKEIVEEVIEGPTITHLSSAISGDVKVLSVEIINGVCVVDLSEEFTTYNTGGSMKESLAIYSIVNSLCANGADSVKFNIEGEENTDFGGHFELSDAFFFEPNMVRIEDR